MSDKSLSPLERLALLRSQKAQTQDSQKAQTQCSQKAHADEPAKSHDETELKVTPAAAESDEMVAEETAVETAVAALDVDVAEIDADDVVDAFTHQATDTDDTNVEEEELPVATSDEQAASEEDSETPDEDSLDWLDNLEELVEEPVAAEDNDAVEDNIDDVSAEQGDVDLEADTACNDEHAVCEEAVVETDEPVSEETVAEAELDVDSELTEEDFFCEDIDDVDGFTTDEEESDEAAAEVAVAEEANEEAFAGVDEVDEVAEESDGELTFDDADSVEDAALEAGTETAVAETAVDNPDEEPAASESLLADLLETPLEDLSFDFSDVGPEFAEEDPFEEAVEDSPLAEDASNTSEVETSPNSAVASAAALLSATEDLEPPAANDPTNDKPEAKYIKTGRGGVKKVGGSNHLDDLFARVSDLLGDTGVNEDEPWKPPVPTQLRDTGLTAEDVERIALKYLNSKGSASGRQIAGQLRLPFNILEPLLKEWKQAQLIGFKNAAEMGDYVYVITDFGRDKARLYMAESTYFGAAPVQLSDYLKAMENQSIAKQHATEADLKRAFSDLLISESMLDRLGPAVNSGRGMFLFGEPGNGKTSIAERITACFGSTIWIPRALGIDGDIIRLFDPGVHEAVDWDNSASHTTGGLFDVSNVDPRWVRITRPTVVAGGELTMDELEVTQNPHTKVCEAPLQLKSNCGTLVIDDFGRQTMPVDQLLNRWIVPLEKRYDFLNLPSGKKIQVPFDQLIIFSTNLEPKDLVDGAFLRRIPYKIEVPDPLPEHFRKLFHIMAPSMGLRVDDEAIEYLVREHFEKPGRPFRACLPRDLLLQVRNYCLYKGLPKVLTPEAFDFAVANYFSVM